MWTWLKRLWTDEDVAARLLKMALTGAAIYLSTPRGRSEWERIIPGLVGAVGLSLPSSRGPA